MNLIKKEHNVSPEKVREFSKRFNVHHIVMEQIIARGNDTPEKITEFLHPSQAMFHNPFLLKGMKECCERVKLAIKNNEKILVFGDYDVDGVSATAIMIKTLKALGKEADYYLPNRYIDGYGLTNDVITKIKNLYNPDLIITVDCGISCYNEVEFAKTLGIEVIVTDHHEIPDVIPQCIVVNAKLPDQEYPFSQLCGTGLAYKIAYALIGKKAEEFLPIACIATIADIVPLTDENRAIVYFGLKTLEHLPVGIKALFKKLKMRLSCCSANEISYKIAPKLNASGRMGDASDSLRLYFSEDNAEILELIKKIIDHNERRKDLCEIVEKDCINILSNMNTNAPSIILSSNDWDQGILGIICAKLAGEFNKPVFLFTEVNGVLKGSARSIPGINVHTILATMSDILETYGGHPIAAGLSLKAENFDCFVRRVNEYLLENIDGNIYLPSESYDIQIKSSDLNYKLLKDIRLLEPCGHENEPIRFMVETSKFEVTPMAKYAMHCNIKPNSILDLVYFNFSKDYERLMLASRLRIVFEFQINSFKTMYKGTVKAIGYDVNENKIFKFVPTLPYFEQMRFVDQGKQAKFMMYSNNNKKAFELNGNFGTAFVVNSIAGFRNFKNNVEFKKVYKIDIAQGVENSGLNCLFICPPSLSFVKSYSKIVFLDAVADVSYIAEINSKTNAEIYIPNIKAVYGMYADVKLDRQLFVQIYSDIVKAKKHSYNMIDLYHKVVAGRRVEYSYKDFYAAIMVFQELGIIDYYYDEHDYKLDVVKTQQTELTNSKFYVKLLELSEKGKKYVRK